MIFMPSALWWCKKLICSEEKLEAGDTILMELVDETKEIKARIVKPIVALNE